MNRPLRAGILIALPAVVILALLAPQMTGMRGNDEIWRDLDRTTDESERVYLAVSLVLRGETKGWTDERRRVFLQRFGDDGRRQLCTLFPLELGRVIR